jgi:hypothetical protein
VVATVYAKNTNAYIKGGTVEMRHRSNIKLPHGKIRRTRNRRYQSHLPRVEFLDLLDETVKALRIFQADNAEVFETMGSPIEEGPVGLTEPFEVVRENNYRLGLDFDRRNNAATTPTTHTAPAGSLVVNRTAVDVLEQKLVSMKRGENELLVSIARCCSFFFLAESAMKKHPPACQIHTNRALQDFEIGMSRVGTSKTSALLRLDGVHDSATCNGQMGTV